MEPTHSGLQSTVQYYYKYKSDPEKKNYNSGPSPSPHKKKLADPTGNRVPVSFKDRLVQGSNLETAIRINEELLRKKDNSQWGFATIIIAKI
jgi:hypothetical protein